MRRVVGVLGALVVLAVTAACGSVAREPEADAAKRAASAGADAPSWLLELRASHRRPADECDDVQRSYARAFGIAY